MKRTLKSMLLLISALGLASCGTVTSSEQSNTSNTSGIQEESSLTPEQSSPAASTSAAKKYVLTIVDEDHVVTSSYESEYEAGTEITITYDVLTDVDIVITINGETYTPTENGKVTFTMPKRKTTVKFVVVGGDEAPQHLYDLTGNAWISNLKAEDISSIEQYSIPIYYNPGWVYDIAYTTDATIISNVVTMLNSHISEPDPSSIMIGGANVTYRINTKDESYEISFTSQGIYEEYQLDCELVDLGDTNVKNAFLSYANSYPVKDKDGNSKGDFSGLEDLQFQECASQDDKDDAYEYVIETGFTDGDIYVYTSTHFRFNDEMYDVVSDTDYSSLF